MRNRHRNLSALLLQIGATALLCAVAGCWNSHAEQEAKRGAEASSGNAKSHDPPPKTAAPAAESQNSPPKSVDAQFGFRQTWKPGLHAADGETKSLDPPAAIPPTAAAQASVAPPAARATIADDRYADFPAAPPVADQKADEPGPLFKAGPLRRAADTRPDRALVAVDAGPSAPPNPLRDPSEAPSERPPESPAIDPPPATPAVPPAIPPAPTVAPQRPESKTELTIATPHNDTPAAPPSAAVVTSPAAPPATRPTPPVPAATEDVQPGPRTNKSKTPFDPIAVYGKYFVDWPKPDLALIITGQQEGYLEPCGCSGFDKMKGGMSRRYTLFRTLRGWGWPVVALDVGGNAKGFGKQAEIKYQIAVNSMNAMRYSSAALGLSDLKLPTTEVLGQTVAPGPGAQTMFVSGNVGLFTFDESLLPRTQIIKTGFKTIGVTSVLGPTFQKQLAGNSDLKIVNAAKVLNDAVPLLKKQADFLILLAHATDDEAIALGKQFPAFDIVVTSGEPGFSPTEPPKDAEEIIKGGTKLIRVGEKGMFAVVLGLYRNPAQPMRYQRVTLDSRFKLSPEMRALMAAYQDQLKEMGLDGLGIHPLPNPLARSNGSYVGSAACQDCHEKSYNIWKKTPHSHAFTTLKQANPPRNFDPECISCHVVGWNPQKYYPYESGFLSEKETPKLVNVGCEDCHGPGQKHIQAENNGTPAQQALYRKAMRNTKEEMANVNSPKVNCRTCHDGDNSLEFQFNLYWPFVKHSEHE